MDELMGFEDSDLEEQQQPVVAPEWERFQRAAYTLQQKKDPLSWWRVCNHFLKLILANL
jgi:hypothetical protein